MATMAQNQHNSHGSMSFVHPHSQDHIFVPSSTYNIGPQQLDLPASTSSDTSADSGPLPNPPFVFPERKPLSSPSSSRSTGRRPKSALELQAPGQGFGASAGNLGRFAPAPLPTFSFNSTTTPVVQAETNGSPPLSPNSTLGHDLLPHPSAHQRSGSGFVGGKSGSFSFGASSTRQDGDTNLPNVAVSSGPPAGRRGHAHRRSAAISCHDLSMILTPPTSASISLGGSAPTTPAATDTEPLTFPTTPRHTLTTSISDPNTSTRLPSLNTPDISPGQTSRARVGFSDTLEFIPRPLSLVSSDASSTMTVRPGGHSVSGSLSSIVSAGTISPAKELRDSTPVNTLQANMFGPTLTAPDLEQPVDKGNSPSYALSVRRRNSVPPVSEAKPNKYVDESDTLKSPRRYMFFGNTDNVEAPAARSPRLTSSASDRRSLSAPPTPESDVETRALQTLESTNSASRRPSSITRKSSKKQKKVKLWAGSILSRKSRPRSKSKAMSRRSPTPPLRYYEPFEPAVEANAIEPATTITNDELAPFTDYTAFPSQIDTDISSWRPRAISPPDDDAIIPIIDLDAALGPFNTPMALGFDPEWEASQGGTKMKKRMHSGGLTRGYRSSEMAIHRRSESAPEMDNPRFSLNRLGSSSTMADVFEEDEEEDWEDTKTVSHRSSRTRVDDDQASGAGVSVSVVDSDAASEHNSMDWSTAEGDSARGVKRKGSGLSEAERRSVMIGTGSAKSIHSTTSLKEDSIAEEPTSLEDAAHDMFQSHHEWTTKTSESTSTPPLRAHTAKDLTPVDIISGPLPPPFLTPASPNSTFQSPFPSPRSTISYDAQRISTAPSSIADDRTFESLLLGEPGPELRMSVDDLPSLTSSDSTVTRESLANPAFSNPQFRTGQRSASISDPTAARKRSSIASLTRLLHSSNGEKSPLSMETRAPDSPEKREKSPKSRRFSRMMSFWKPKEPSQL